MKRQVLPPCCRGPAAPHARGSGRKPVSASVSALLPELAAGVDVDEAYRAQFDLCDSQNEFEGQTFQRWGGCRGDPNRAVLLRRLPGGPIAYVSKLAVDLDGSPFALRPQPPAVRPVPDLADAGQRPGEATPLDADRVPYVVIPSRGEFSRLTGVRVGDFGVVIKDGVVAPVVVGDTGPPQQTRRGLPGPASGARPRAVRRARRRRRLHRRPLRHHQYRGRGDTILFPGSARDDLTPDNVEARGPASRA